MTTRIDIFPSPVVPARKPAAAPPKAAGDFAATLREIQQRSGVSFSAHALERLRQRDLPLGEKELGRIGEAMDSLRQKGGSSSLLLYGEMALVASIKNNTIITAMDRNQMRHHVFTGIDSAVIIQD